MTFVIDNSVTMAWCFAEEKNPYTSYVLRKLKMEQAFAPALWPLEFGNVLLVAERKGRIKESETTWYIEMVKELPISIEQDPPERLFSNVFFLAREQKLSTYDAAYLDLAMRMGISLATQDKELRRAAQTVGVKLVALPEAL